MEAQQQTLSRTQIHMAINRLKYERQRLADAPQRLEKARNGWFAGIWSVPNVEQSIEAGKAIIAAIEKLLKDHGIDESCWDVTC